MVSAMAEPTRRVVHKYEVPFGESALTLPRGAELLHVATQPKDPQGTEGVFVWALVDPDASHTIMQIGYFATGEPIPAGAEYIGTAITPDKTFVWHVFAGPQMKASR